MTDRELLVYQRLESAITDVSWGAYFCEFGFFVSVSIDGKEYVTSTVPSDPDSLDYSVLTIVDQIDNIRSKHNGNT